MSHSRRTPVNDDMETISGLEDGETAADDVEPSCESYATEGSILNRASDKDTQQNDTIDLKATKQSLHARSNSSFRRVLEHKQGRRDPRLSWTVQEVKRQ
ncbi:hypothetical protein PC128_g278 [Phytophthora cactorum]|nr:hypothetical protein PC120_g1071 [Phytophthora cactorum]KAG3207188.1 hypothetical protein PC128_g278 [Phytophthora cactorum]